MRRLPFVFLFSLLGLSLIATDCGGGGAGKVTGTPTPSSGLEGTVGIGPTCPVERIDTPCPDKPYQANIIIMNLAGGTVKAFQSAQDGTFRIALASGTYTLHPQSPNPGSFPVAQDQSVDVRDGSYTSVTIQFDSGIR